MWLTIICWAFAGIAIKQSATPLVETTAIVLTILLLVILASALLVSGRETRKTPPLGAAPA